MNASTTFKRPGRIYPDAEGSTGDYTHWPRHTGHWRVGWRHGRFRGMVDVVEAVAVLVRGASCASCRAAETHLRAHGRIGRSMAVPQTEEMDVSGLSNGEAFDVALDGRASLLACDAGLSMLRTVSVESLRPQAAQPSNAGQPSPDSTASKRRAHAAKSEHRASDQWQRPVACVAEDATAMGGGGTPSFWRRATPHDGRLGGRKTEGTPMRWWRWCDDDASALVGLRL